MWFKHFASGLRGSREAYHIGVFGKTGSGKSGLAKMMLCAYSRHRDMGIFVIDPQGESSLELSGTRVGEQGLKLDQVLRGQGRRIYVYRIDDLQLDDWQTFGEMLMSLRFLERQRHSASDLRRTLRQRRSGRCSVKPCARRANTGLDGSS